MTNFNLLGPLLFISGVAVLVLVVVAIAQDLRQERKYGYRQAFYTIVTLVMLVLSVGSGIMLVTVGLQETVLKSAKTYQARYYAPPQLFLPGTADKTTGVQTAHTCTSGCQFTSDDKSAFASWKTSYQAWNKFSEVSNTTRRNLAGALSMFLVAAPLYWLFMRWMNRGTSAEMKNHQKPSPLTSVYFYGMSFGGLILAVVGGAMLINAVIGTWLKTDEQSYPRATPVAKDVSTTGIAPDTVGVDSVIACATRCGFTADDTALATKWKQDWQAYQAGQNSTTGALANNMIGTIPLVLFGVPLFWYHFTRIRREGHDGEPTPTQPNA